MTFVSSWCTRQASITEINQLFHTAQNHTLELAWTARKSLVKLHWKLLLLYELKYCFRLLYTRLFPTNLSPLGCVSMSLCISLGVSYLVLSYFHDEQNQQCPVLLNSLVIDINSNPTMQTRSKIFILGNNCIQECSCMVHLCSLQ